VGIFVSVYAKTGGEKSAMKIAIIGTGISGLTAAYLLNRKHDISVFEAGDTIGGHTATVDIQMPDGEKLAIDTGFIVYNEWTYPNFIKLLTQLGISGQKTEMSFSVHDDRSGLEYGGNNLNTLFTQRSNVLKPSFLRMVRDILRFNKASIADLESGLLSPEMTLDEYLKKMATVRNLWRIIWCRWARLSGLLARK
jgi:predicted NAD/FAD-binding protein